MGTENSVSGLAELDVWPSIYAAERGTEKEVLSLLPEKGATGVHVDVMDGRVVPSSSWSVNDVAGFVRDSPLPVEAHLMVEDSDSVVKELLSVGLYRIFVHPEWVSSVGEVLQTIRANDVGAGLVLSPGLDVEVISKWADKIDSLLVMTSQPGMRSAPFEADSFARVQDVISFLESSGFEVSVGVDGGVTFERLSIFSALGVTHAVIGRDFFRR